MRWLRWFWAGCLLAAPAEAASVRLDLGADAWLNTDAEFNLTLAPQVRLARHVLVGGRLGALLVASDPVVAGMPLDLDLRFQFPRSSLYLEGLAGPWLLFKGTTVHAHGAIGLGFLAGSVSFGIEVGYLDPNAVLGARLGFVL